MEDVLVSAVLDDRLLPAAEREQAVLLAFSALPVGGCLELITDHEPRPLRAEFIAQWARQHDWQPLENSPLQWRSRITRLAAKGCCGGCGGGGH